jgi:hypothetical protein
MGMPRSVPTSTSFAGVLRNAGKPACSMHCIIFSRRQKHITGVDKIFAF